MLEIRPSCESCDRDLPPHSADARICSYECTFCVRCVDEVLGNVCPNCGGGFTPRPVRPQSDYGNGTGLGNHPATRDRVYRQVDHEAQIRLRGRLETVPPDQR
jgi:hypothetical protein